MAPSKTTKTASATAVATKPAKKEKVFHPQSRKAGQLARKALRKGKLGNLVTKRGNKNHSLVDVYGFFFHAIPDDGTLLTLEELHSIVADLWLTRFDSDLEEERSARRKGRAKSVKEVKLEELKLREAEEYRTGMEVPDLTHAANVELFQRWDQKETAFIRLLRFIRISSSSPETAIVSRKGKHFTLNPSVGDTAGEDMAMDVSETTPLLTDASTTPFLEGSFGSTKFGSTIMAMDG